MLEVTALRLVTQRFLSGMERPQLDALATAASEVSFPARQRIFTEGDNADHFWLVQSGYVALDVMVPGEGLIVIGRAGLGDLVGWSWLVPPYEWAFGAVCVTEVRAFQFDAQAVRDLCAADAVLRDELARRLLQVVVVRLKDTRTRFVTRSYGPSPYSPAGIG